MCGSLPTLLFSYCINSRTTFMYSYFGYTESRSRLISLWPHVWESGCRISERRRTNMTNVGLVLFTSFRQISALCLKRDAFPYIISAVRFTIIHVAASLHWQSSLWRSEFDHSPLFVRFVVESKVLQQGFLRAIWCSPLSYHYTYALYSFVRHTGLVDTNKPTGGSSTKGHTFPFS